MVYLAKIMLNARSRRVGAELRDPYQMHKTLCHAFPDEYFSHASPREKEEKGQALRMLFRVDDDNDTLFVLLQSKLPPDMAKLSNHLASSSYLCGPPVVREFKTRKDDETPIFHEGQKLRFRLVANPTKADAKAKRGKRNTGTRRGLYAEWEQLDWLRRQCIWKPKDEPERERFSFELIETTITRKLPDKEPEVFKQDLPRVQVVSLNDGKRFPMPGHNCQFSAARFDGVLTVTDPEAFTHAVECGIGSGKAFGFGLLSVAKC